MGYGGCFFGETESLDADAVGGKSEWTDSVIDPARRGVRLRDFRRFPGLAGERRRLAEANPNHIPMATGLLFSGQGAQHIGMGRSLYEASATARDLYSEAGKVLGWDLASLCFEGPEAELTQTAVCQPALYVHGYSVFRMLGERGLLEDAEVACGLSLGELTALAAAGACGFADGLRLVAERGRLMQEACDATRGGMASVIGGEPEAVRALCEAHDVEVANYNCPGQIVISGEADRIQAAVADSDGRGIRMVKPLNVAGAYHSRLMAPSRDAFAEFIRDFRFEPPAMTVYANVSGEPVREPEAIREALVRQIVSPVRFEECLRHAAVGHGVERFYECGPGKVLAGLARRTDKAITVTPVAEWDDPV